MACLGGNTLLLITCNYPEPTTGRFHLRKVQPRKNESKFNFEKFFLSLVTLSLHISGAIYLRDYYNLRSRKWNENDTRGGCRMMDGGWFGPGQYYDILLTMSYDNSWNDEHKNCRQWRPNVPSSCILGLCGQTFFFVAKATQVFTAICNSVCEWVTHFVSHGWI